MLARPRSDRFAKVQPRPAAGCASPGTAATRGTDAAARRRHDTRADSPPPGRHATAVDHDIACHDAARDHAATGAASARAGGASGATSKPAAWAASIWLAEPLRTAIGTTR